jgi:tankyrase
MLRLSPELGTLALCASYPRIANELSAMWDDPFAAHAYFAMLLLDGRGGRRGFPEEVLAELLALQARYELEHPPAANVWRDR